MAFKPVTNVAIDIKKEPGKQYIGTYVNKETIQTKLGPAFVYNFNDNEGAPFAIYGFTNLNRVMENMKLGVLLRITYQGTKNVKTKFGQKDVHQVLVEMDDKDGDPETVTANGTSGEEIPF